MPAKLLLTTLALRAKDEAQALKQFETLGERIKKDSLQGTNNRIATVVVPAFADPKYAALLVPIVEKLAENHIIGNNTAKAVELRFLLAQYHLGRKDEAAARAQFKVVEGFGKDTDQRAPPTMGTWAAAQGILEGPLGRRRRPVNLACPSTASRPPEPTPAAGRGDRNRRSTNTRAWCGSCSKCRPRSRYAALKTWSLPTAGRKSVRYFVGVMPSHLPPPAFVKLPPFPVDEVVSTMLLMAEAAREAGKLGELTAEAEKLAADKIENGRPAPRARPTGPGQGKAGRAGGEGVRRGGSQAFEREAGDAAWLALLQRGRRQPARSFLAQ